MISTTNSAYWVILHAFCSQIFLKINIFEKLFQEYHQSVKQLGSLQTGKTKIRLDKMSG